MDRVRENEFHGRFPTRIIDWYFVNVEGEQRPCIEGIHYGHSRYVPDEEIKTATIRDFYYGDHALRITCEDGMEYMLGKIDPEYEEKYPGIIEKAKTFYKKLNKKE